MDDSLFSGFLTAIFAISKELSIDKIQAMDMEDVKFIYENVPPFLLILNVNKDVSVEFGKSILSRAMKYFEKIFDGLNEEVKSDLNELTEELKKINSNAQIDKFINDAILEEYFKTPLKIVDTMETYLVSLFGSMGKEIIETSILKICKIRVNFKKENLTQLLSIIEESLGKKTTPSQASMITQQLRDTFSQEK